MKKYLKLVPAVAMLLLATVLVGTAAYAWLAMNSHTAASGMVVQAMTESDNILITNATSGVYAQTATAVTSGVTLRPVSTADVSTWYHNTSSDVNNAMASQADASYASLTLAKSATTYGVGYVEDATPGYQGSEARYYLLNTFTIKPSSDRAMTAALYINKVFVTGVSTSADYDKSLRIAIKIENDSNTYIFAPFNGATTTYKVGGSSQADTTIHDYDDVNIATTIGSIPAAGLGVQVYAYFEGEDANCKSVNLDGLVLDNLAAAVVFGTGTTTTFELTQNLTGLASSYNAPVIVNTQDLFITFTPDTGSLPGTVTVTINGTPATAGTEYTYSSTTGILKIPAANITGAVVITAAEIAP